MNRILRILCFSGFLYLFIFPPQSHAAKFAQEGAGTQFTGNASVTINIRGERYSNTDDPVDDFSGSGNDIASPSGDPFNTEQALVQITDDVEESRSYNLDVISASSGVRSSQSSYTTWFDTEGGEMGPIIPDYVTSLDWVPNHVNAVSVGSYCDARVTAKRPSYYKYNGDSSESNNDILGANISASVENQPATAQFTIEPMLMEHTGDSVELTVYNNSPYSYTHDFDDSSPFYSSTSSYAEVMINGTAVDVPTGGNSTVTVQIGDTVTLTTGTGLLTYTNEKRIPDTYSTFADYSLHSCNISKYISMEMPETPGLTQENPIIGSGTPLVSPSIVILSEGPGIDVPVWFRATDGEDIEIEVQGAELSKFVMPGILSYRGPITLDPEDETDGAEVWYYSAGTWVEAETSPLPETGFTSLPAGVTKIQIRGIDKDSTDPEENIFNAGLIFSGAANDVTVTISNAVADSNEPGEDGPDEFPWELFYPAFMKKK